MVNRIIEAGPVNWSKPLAEYYAEDAKKWERQRKLEETRDKQQAVVDKAENITKIPEALAKFTTSGMKLKEALDAKAGQAELEDNKEAQRAIFTLGDVWPQKQFELQQAEWRVSKNKRENLEDDEK